MHKYASAQDPLIGQAAELSACHLKCMLSRIDPLVIRCICSNGPVTVADIECIITGGD